MEPSLEPKQNDQNVARMATWYTRKDAFHAHHAVIQNVVNPLKKPYHISKKGHPRGGPFLIADCHLPVGRQDCQFSIFDVIDNLLLLGDSARL